MNLKPLRKFHRDILHLFRNVETQGIVSLHINFIFCAFIGISVFESYC
jgi:hypothetical protein